MHRQFPQETNAGGTKVSQMTLSFYLEKKKKAHLLKEGKPGMSLALGKFKCLWYLRDQRIACQGSATYNPWLKWMQMAFMRKEQTQ